MFQNYISTDIIVVQKIMCRWEEGWACNIWCSHLWGGAAHLLCQPIQSNPSEKWKQDGQSMFFNHSNPQLPSIHKKYFLLERIFCLEMRTHQMSDLLFHLFDHIITHSNSSLILHPCTPLPQTELPSPLHSLSAGILKGVWESWNGWISRFWLPKHSILDTKEQNKYFWIQFNPISNLL